MVKNNLNVVLVIGMLLGSVFCLWRMTRGSPTTTETLLLSLVLTIFSVIGSWVASRFYSETSFDTNLRTFALKAAEKVTNLSNELDRLSIFLQQELKENEYDTPQEAMLAKNVRIESAIHIINTLKSVNDRSLSDWQGVIRDEISEQRERQVEREETLREILERLDLAEDQPTHTNNPQPDSLRSEVQSIRDEIRLLAAQVSGVPIRPLKILKGRQQIEQPCPACHTPLSYSQRHRPNSVKAMDCSNCGKRLYSRLVDGDYVLQIRSPVDETVACPVCAQKLTVSIDPVPGSSVETRCLDCGSALRVTRLSKGLKLKAKEVKISPAAPPGAVLGEEILKRVADAMGNQPWPKGQARKVAEELGIDHDVVSRAIQQLVNRGTFKVQIGGKLYVVENLRSDPV